MSLLVGMSHGFVVSLKPVMIGSTNCFKFTRVMCPQIVLRNSWFQYSSVSFVEIGSSPPRKCSRSKMPSVSEFATTKLQTPIHSPAHCVSIVEGELYHCP